MLTRIIYGLVLLPLVVIIVNFGGLPLRISLFFLSVISLYELYKSIFPKRSLLDYFGYIFIFFYYFFINTVVYYFFVFTLVWIIINLIYMVLNFNKINLEKCICYIVLPIYTAVFLSTIYLVREISAYLVWFIFLSSWGSDTFCYFVGKFFGTRKLAKNLSPNKTIEGSIGGIVGACLVGVFYAIFFPNNYYYLLSINLIIMYAIIFSVLALFSQIGDLVASAIKRQNDVKDFGDLIPGHGGVMDRFDSILLTAPVFYIFITFTL